MSHYLFYPGCSMTRSARPYLDSFMAIRDELGIDVEEVRDWNCCGATEYAAVHGAAAYALVGRNLALAEKQVDGTRTLLAGCSACYLNLAKTDHMMRENPRFGARINEALAAGDLHYDPGSVEVRHLLDVIYNEVGLDAIRRRVVRPLQGLRAAPYYGCMIVRPDPDHRFDSPEYPLELDRLLRVLGVEVVSYPQKTQCCGGHMTQISPPVAYELIRRLVQGAEQNQAHIIVTLCPMCQLNLDAFQSDMNDHFNTDYHIPVLYFTQLLGLAFGHEPAELGLRREFVSSREALAYAGVDVPIEEEEVPAPRRRRRAKDDPSLPMPKMPGDEEALL
ncbi:MAG TPA: CoB--CoM heterodisulfide reductase iron-sulfur subunit B family protein [Candidatus Binatia bacterium]|nr:CoB--CoM heterodisulfide reductase iron-sulfur subunit B family protein [Candidatus Binatia bacterium]